MIASILLLGTLASTAFSHGLITSPPSRVAGTAMQAACGTAVTALVQADNTSHVEGMPEAAATTANFNSTACNVFLCKGLQFADNTANVQNFTAGQVVNMRASIPIPHEGPMNVSIINTQTNTAIGAPLITFDSYADESLAALPANNTNFNVTIPNNLGTNCTTAGTCVLQWFWFGTAADQTYESCVDMVVAAKA
ncbi:related to chitin binding protein [Phialocephala subalpina]|uniref:Related to chitin binding protein n=1 Tax=Phialocephala subalpina TaxID=576137 RepID=A0A1L7XMU2_9HELO|nr:related to chitin binding protein [Phialocephala subalpina]